MTIANVRHFDRALLPIAKDIEEHPALYLLVYIKKLLQLLSLPPWYLQSQDTSVSCGNVQKSQIRSNPKKTPAYTSKPQSRNKSNSTNPHHHLNQIPKKMSTKTKVIILTCSVPSCQSPVSELFNRLGRAARTNGYVIDIDVTINFLHALQRKKLQLTTSIKYHFLTHM